MITDDILIATNTTKDVGIEGVLITPLKQFKDDRGSVMKIIDDDLYDDDDNYKPNTNEIAEVYLSTIKPGVVKGWHGHKFMTLNYVCIVGRIIVGLCDLREGKTYGKIAAVYLDDVDHYRMLTIPPGVWNGFRIHPDSDLSPGILLNAASHVHSLDEIERIHPREFPIPFDWGDYEIAG
ncbi:hypothetical protein LCGC14_2549480 [marine sediment metagenome]|uniref:dTDP-4-dehydrorhamnose 3,5-epimerase n=1 Tax=marine sediment metagenome TaxID=412755 RepID=A0A0F9BB58_9ZZZZ